jgi:hypothetical protein
MGLYVCEFKVPQVCGGKKNFLSLLADTQFRAPHCSDRAALYSADPVIRFRLADKLFGSKVSAFYLSLSCKTDECLQFRIALCHIISKLLLIITS